MQERRIIKWLDNYKTGIQEIDVQHILIIDLINDLYVNLINGTNIDKNIMLETLKENSEANFKTEEFFMRRHGYDRYEVHKKEHDETIMIMNNYIKKFKKNGEIDMYKFFLFVNDWVFKHLEEEDALLRKFVLDNNIKTLLWSKSL